MRLGDVLVARFGLRTARSLQSDDRGGSRSGIFKGYEANAVEVVMGEDDRPLDFGASALYRFAAEAGAIGSSFGLSTVVHCHNRLGRGYLGPIAPIHRLIVRLSSSGMPMLPLRSRSAGSCCFVAVCISSAASAAGPPDSAALLAAERDAMRPLAIFDGTWRGPATITQPDGKVVTITQTERVGPFLGDTVKLIEGRGYAADGSVAFNALGVISYVPQSGRYAFHSYAQGYAGDFAFSVRPDGYTWSIPAGPATLRYQATVKAGVWSESGERVVDGQAPVRTFEMTLRRTGDSDWPAAGAVPAK